MMNRILGIGIALLVVLSLAGTALAAAGSGGAAGQVKGGNTPPTATSATLKDTGGTPITSMDPLGTYLVDAVIGDINTVDDIKDVEFRIYIGTAAGSWDADERGIFKWNKTASWTMENGSATTSWALVTAQSSIPADMTQPSGTWRLGFKPGKLAQYVATQSWFVQVNVTDNSNATASVTSAAGAALTAYAEVSVSAATVDFGEIVLGGTSNIQAPVAKYITTNAIANKAYALGSMSSATWSDGGSNTLALSGTTGIPGTGGQFSMAIDDSQQGASGNPATPQAITSTNTTITGHGADARVSTAASSSEAAAGLNLWMQVWMANSGIQKVTYQGTITFTVTN